MFETVTMNRKKVLEIIKGLEGMIERSPQGWPLSADTLATNLREACEELPRLVEGVEYARAEGVLPLDVSLGECPITGCNGTVAFGGPALTTIDMELLVPYRCGDCDTLGSLHYQVKLKNVSLLQPKSGAGIAHFEKVLVDDTILAVIRSKRNSASVQVITDGVRLPLQKTQERLLHLLKDGRITRTGAIDGLYSVTKKGGA